MALLNFDTTSFKYVAASFFATYCSGLTHPLDVIKTRLQSHDGKGKNDNLVPKYSSIKDAFKSIYRDQGLRGLFKGFYISLLCQASSIALFFWIYQVRKGQYELYNCPKMQAVTMASVEASIISTVITQPIWVVKTRMLLNVNKGIGQLDNFRRQSREIYGQYGLRGFLKGLQLSLVLASTGVVQMYLYQGAKTLYQHYQIPQSGLSQKHFICGGLSKIFSVLWSYPITTIRTRIQQNQFVNNSKTQKYSNCYEITQKMLKEEGVRGLFKGINANIMRGVGQKGIYFYCYEGIKNVMNQKKE